VNVRDALVADPRVLPAGASARDVAELLSRPHVETALVVDGERLVGCVTREAVVAAVARGQDVQGLTAGDLADGGMTTIGPDVPLDDALRLMAEGDLDRLPVTEGDRLLGVLPRDGLVRRIAEDEAPADEPAPH
jgi:CBS domain-containing protein